MGKHTEKLNRFINSYNSILEIRNQGPLGKCLEIPICKKGGQGKSLIMVKSQRLQCYVCELRVMAC